MMRRRGLWLLALVAAIGSGCPEKRQPHKTGAPASGVSQPPGSAEERGPGAQKRLYEEAKRLLRAGKPAEAVKVFGRAAAAAPDGELLANCHLGMASAHGDLGQHERAVAALQKVVALRPSDPEAYRTLAIGLQDARRLGPARQALEQALALDPDQLSAYQELAALHVKEKNIEGAKKAYLGYELTRTRLIRRLGLAKDEKQREAAARALADARDEATAKALGLALTDRSRVVRLAVIRALGQMRLPQGVGPLRALGKKTRDPEERRLIQLSLQAIANAPEPHAPAHPAPGPPDGAEAGPSTRPGTKASNKTAP